MKEKYFNDLGLDNGEDLLKKFNLFVIYVIK